MLFLIPWILLKTIPSISNYFDIANIRKAGYIFLASIILFSLLTKFVFLRARKPDKGLIILGVLYTLVLIINLGVSNIESTKAETLLLARSLFLIITLSIFLKYNKNLKFIIYSLIIYFSIIQVLSILTYLNIIKESGVFSDERNIGILSSTFTLSYSSIIYLGIFLILLENISNISIRTGLYIMVIVCILNCYFAISRTSLVGICIIGIFLIIEKNRRSIKHRKKALGIISAIIVAIPICGIVIASHKDKPYLLRDSYSTWKLRMEILINEGTKGQERRWLTNLAGINTFAKYPLTGVGWDNSSSFAMVNGAIIDSTAHNVIIQSAAEGGVLGIAFSILLFFIIPFKYYEGNKYVPGSWIFIGSWIAIIFFNMIASNLHLEAHWDILIFWILITRLNKKYESKNALAKSGS